MQATTTRCPEAIIACRIVRGTGQCCTGNVQRALPNFVERMWMRGQGDKVDEIVAALFGPGQVTTQVAGTHLTIRKTPRYPFEQTVSFIVSPQQPVRFTFTVRIPGGAAIQP